MTCKEFRRCRHFQLGAYECDHIGKDCGKLLNVEIAGVKSNQNACKEDI